MGLLAGCVPMGISLIGQGTVAVVGENRSLTDLVSDKITAARVLTALHRDPKTAHLMLWVYVFQGHLFLIGEKEREEDQQAAEAVALSIGGVRAVESHLLQKRPFSVQEEAEDLLMTTEVKAAIFQNPDLVYGRFSIKTLQGKLFLLGVVASQQEADLAISLAQGAVGSHQVVPLLRVPEGEASLQPVANSVGLE